MNYNERGSILIQVMIGASMMAGIALMMAKVTENSRKSIDSVLTGLAIEEKVIEIKTALSSPEACFDTFEAPYLSGDTFNIPELSKIIDKRGNTVLELEKKSPDGYESVKQQAVWMPNGEVSLNIDFKRKKKSYGGRVLTKKFLLRPNWIDNNNGGVPFLIDDVDSDGNAIKRLPDSTEVVAGIEFTGCKLSGVVDSSGGSGASPEEVCAVIEGATWDVDLQTCNIGGVYQCLEEKRQLSESPSGGMTTKCTPNENIAGTMLTGGKERQKCLDDGGGYFFDSVNGVSMCRFASSTDSCSTGWTGNGYKSYKLVKKLPAGFEAQVDPLLPEPPSSQTPFVYVSSIAKLTGNEIGDVGGDNGSIEITLNGISPNPIEFHSAPRANDEYINGFHDIVSGIDKGERWLVCGDANIGSKQAALPPSCWEKHDDDSGQLLLHAKKTDLYELQTVFVGCE